MKRTIAKSLMLAVLAAGCGTMEPQSSQVKVEPITVAKTAYAAYSAFSAHRDKERAQREIAGLKSEMRVQADRIISEIQALDVRQSVAVGQGVILAFEGSNWESVDINGSNAVAQLERVVRDNSGINTQKAVEMLNLVAPAVGISRLMRGKEPSSSIAEFNTVYRTNETFLTSKVQNIGQTMVTKTLVNPIGANLLWKGSGFKLPVRDYNDNEVYTAAARTLEIYRSIVAAQVDVATVVGKPAFNPPFLEGTFIMDSGAVVRARADGTSCWFPNWDVVRRLTPFQNDQQISASYMIPAAYFTLYQGKGACGVDDLGLAWSSAGAIPRKYCTQWNEALDPHTWDDNYLCSDFNLGMRFHNAGPIPGMRCVSVNEPADPASWGDNYMCLPLDSPVSFGWSVAGPLTGNPYKQCVQVSEAADPYAWMDNFLCWFGGY
jgi:hypothetical protein